MYVFIFITVSNRDQTVSRASGYKWQHLINDGAELIIEIYLALVLDSILACPLTIKYSPLLKCKLGSLVWLIIRLDHRETMRVLSIEEKIPRKPGFSP